jgi:flagellar biosynthesis protein FlhG
MQDDLYAVLGLEPRATGEQVERAYRFCLGLYAEGSLATYSLLEPNEAEAQRLRVKEAYQTLVDPERRRHYDESRGLEPPEREVLAFPTAASRAAAGASPAEPPELPKVVSGPQLRRMREARGVSLRHVSAVTKIGTRFLEYIEQDRFSFLPAPVYLRGFLQEYAKVIGIDPRRLSDAYMARLPRS